MSTQYVSRTGASRYLTERGIEVKPQTLRVWSSTGRYSLPFIRIGRLIRYEIGDLDRFIQAHKVNPGEAA